MKHLALLFVFACGPKPAATSPGPAPAPAPTPAPSEGSGGGGDHSCICPMIYQPVCGADGKTYSNSCAAGCAKVAVKSNGACS